MSTTILTDEQKAQFVTDIADYGTGFVAPLFAVVEAIEQAVLQSPEIQARMEAYAAAKVREAQRWHPIDSAPHETLVVLGWYDENEVFKQEIALASAGRRYPGGASDMWWHGRATHWMPLPAPPLPGPVEPTT